jgi:quercetin dioxygenase-like cupin family protein
MTFHRFENYEARTRAVHLSTGQTRKIVGKYVYFGHVGKAPGTGSVLHYHPNDFMVFVLTGKANAICGKDRRVITPGTLMHVPPCARHSVKATEEGMMTYLAIKEPTWSMVGSAADEPLPDAAPVEEEVWKTHAEGKWPGRDKSEGESQVVIEGIGNAFYQMIDSFDAPAISAQSVRRVIGPHINFAFYDLPKGYEEPLHTAEHERFIYMVHGGIEAGVGGQIQTCGPDDVIEIPRGSEVGFKVIEGPARFVSVQPTPKLEAWVDSQS